MEDVAEMELVYRSAAKTLHHVTWSPDRDQNLNHSRANSRLAPQRSVGNERCDSSRSQVFRTAHGDQRTGEWREAELPLPGGWRGASRPA